MGWSANHSSWQVPAGAVFLSPAAPKVPRTALSVQSEGRHPDRRRRHRSGDARAAAVCPGGLPSGAVPALWPWGAARARLPASGAAGGSGRGGDYGGALPLHGGSLRRPLAVVAVAAGTSLVASLDGGGDGAVSPATAELAAGTAADRASLASAAAAGRAAPGAAAGRQRCAASGGGRCPDRADAQPGAAGDGPGAAAGSGGGAAAPSSARRPSHVIVVHRRRDAARVP